MLCFGLALAGATGFSGELVLTVQGKVGQSGTVYASLCNNKKDLELPKGVNFGGFGKLDATGKAVISFKKLKAGDYAIKLFLDQNANRDLDCNLLGIPKEPFGFSNNVKPRLGMPKWERLKFVVAAKGVTHHAIQLQD